MPSSQPPSAQRRVCVRTLVFDCVYLALHIADDDADVIECPLLSIDEIAERS